MIALTAGFLFTISATTSAGTVLREDRALQIRTLIDKKLADNAALNAEAEKLRADVEEETGELAKIDDPIAQERARAAAYQQAAALTALHGPGLTVRLDDSPRLSDGSKISVAEADQLVIHQQDIDSVLNALWAGGAEAVTIMDVRVTTTTAIRCVGNSLLLQGRRYSPEFTVRAIGDPDRLRAALAASPGVRTFEEAAEIYGLGYSVTNEADVVAPAYRGSTDLRFARVPD